MCEGERKDMYYTMCARDTRGALSLAHFVHAVCRKIAPVRAQHYAS